MLRVIAILFCLLGSLVVLKAAHGYRAGEITEIGRRTSGSRLLYSQSSPLNQDQKPDEFRNALVNHGVLACCLLLPGIFLWRLDHHFRYSDPMLP